MDEINEELNKPLAGCVSFGETDREFLKMLMKMVNEGRIDLHGPSSILNTENYQKLSEEKKGKADLEAFNMINVIRDIKGLYDAGYVETYQMENLVERLRDTKERLEKEDGDIFII